MLRYRTLIPLVILLLTNTINSMVYDSRYLPLFQLPYVTVPERSSHNTINTFITTASRLFEREDKEVGLQELWGVYDQVKVAYALECQGKENLLLPEWRNFELNWHMEGKQQSQGFAISFHKSIYDRFFVGVNTFFMRFNAYTEFTFDEDSPNQINNAGNLQELEEIRRKMNDQLNLSASSISQVGFGDFDFYAGAFGDWDYVCKFRHVFTDFRVGCIAPSGVRHDINKLGSIPFGGDGHWGIYVSNWSEFEVKEDWKAGFVLRAIKRLEKKKTMRMPSKGEILPFAAEIGCVKVDPAATFVFAPYFGIENLREGFGLRAVYTLRTHGKDYWCDARGVNAQIPIDLKEPLEKTSWNADYFTINAFYDFGKTKVDRSFAPILYAAWDIPSAMLATKRIAKTHRISLGVQLTF